MSWKPEVQVAGEPGIWHSNSLCFATKAEAENNARELMSKWMLVVATRANESDEPVNYRWENYTLITAGE